MNMPLTAGIFEMRPFYWKNKSKIPIYGSRRTISALKKPIAFFVQKHDYKPIMKAKIINKHFQIIKIEINYQFNRLCTSWSN